MPADGPKDFEIGDGRPPTAGRRKKGDRTNPRGRPRAAASLAALLRRALDAPADAADGKRRRLSKREQMIRGLVERSAGGELAATKLLFEILRRTDPRALGPDPAAPSPFGEDALAQLKQRLERLACTQTDDASNLPEPPAPADPNDPKTPAS